MRKILQEAQRIVIKVGTSTLIHPNREVNLTAIDQLAFSLSALRKQGKEIIFVSSGAIGVGLNKLNLTQRPTAIPEQQAVAAIGQLELMNIYNLRFSSYQQLISQVLLTRDVVDFPESYKNVQNTLEQLLKMNVIPIINENDTVSIDELDHQTKFGDNDQLSALVCSLTEADCLIMLSDIDGFYSANPALHPEATLFQTVAPITDEHFALAGDTNGHLGTGGMHSKLKAAKYVTERGAAMLLANGQHPKIILDLLAGQELGTYFPPQA